MYEASGKNEEGIVVPPGCDCSILHESGEKVKTFTPSSYRPMPSALPAHTMRGKTGSLSVPQVPSTFVRKNMTEYLRKFQGAYVCMDLWFHANQKMKICGILLEIGETFLVFQDPNRQKISLADLSSVRYLTIYCK